MWGFSLVVEKEGYSLAAVHWHLIAQASLVEHVGSRVGTCGLGSMAPRLSSTGSMVVAHGFGCPAAWGIFPDQGSNLRLLHWQADS